MFVRSLRNELSIWAMPLSRPEVQTFVAMKRLDRIDAVRSPATSSERPYIGEESMTLPPAETNSRRTSTRGARADGDEPVSNVCQVPRPMTGIGSPEEGTRRVSTRAC